MPTSNQLPQITERQILALASPKAFERGCKYLERGAVLGLVLRGKRLFAEVEGSDYDPYTVTIELGKGGVKSTSCTCPYDFEGACKHVVATLLAYMQSPEQIEVHPSTEELIAPLTPDQLRKIVLAMAEREPKLADLVEHLALASSR